MISANLARQLCKTTKMGAGKFNQSFFQQGKMIRSFLQTFNRFRYNFNTSKITGTKKEIGKMLEHNSALGTSPQCIRSGPNLVYS